MTTPREITVTEALTCHIWPAANFHPSEIACKQHSARGRCGCGGVLVIDQEALTKLQKLRDLAGCAVILNSAYRCAVHNRNVAGAPYSEHRNGRAFDIRITGDLTRQKIHKLAQEVGFRGIGDYDNFVHVDTGIVRSWDNRTR